jgi:hypothetical protein
MDMDLAIERAMERMGGDKVKEGDSTASRRIYAVLCFVWHEGLEVHDRRLPILKKGTSVADYPD